MTNEKRTNEEINRFAICPECGARMTFNSHFDEYIHPHFSSLENCKFHNSRISFWAWSYIGLPDTRD